MSEKLFVEYMDHAPDTVGSEEVADRDLTKLNIPVDAVQFRFYGLSKPTELGIHYVLSEHVASPDDLKKQGGPTETFDWYASRGVQHLARIELTDGTKQTLYFPVYKGHNKVVSPTTRQVIWPKAGD